jgi:uncharacterized membrane protein
MMMLICLRSVSACIAVAVGICSTASAQPQFVLLHPAGSASGGTQALGISADGSFIAGLLDTSPGSEAYRWSINGNATPLGFLNSPGLTRGVAVSNGGAVVAGEALDSTSGVQQGFRWTASQGMQGIGFLDGHNASFVNDLSANGSTIVGFSSGGNSAEAFRHTVDGGMQGLGMLSGTIASIATVVSGDGNVISGYCYDRELGDRIFRWTPQSGMIDLGFVGQINDMSLDGSALVGRAKGAPVIWREGQGLSTLPYAHGHATGVTADGSTVVGNAYFEHTIDEPFIWNATDGGRKLSDFLTDAGINLNGFTLTGVQDISADGTVIIGTGSLGGGGQRGFVAIIPSPPAFALFALTLIASKRRRG